ncbi:MAG: DEAD/DEAH box helicase family protein [Isosphaeraceae bacterium]
MRLFPDPVKGGFKSISWHALGAELARLLTAEEYESARRSVFNAFYTSPTVVASMYLALERFGVPRNATVLEPGCGSGNFLGAAPEGMRFVGIELDSITGRIARALYPQHDIRVENFRDTKIHEGSLDAVLGNPPFAEVRLEWRGTKMPLHDYFIVKSLDALKPGGILVVVTSHFTLDKQNAASREAMASRADFLGAIRLPSDAFQREGTRVVTDILCLRRRGTREPERHVDHEWLDVSPLYVNGTRVTINRYFHRRPEMVLGTFSYSHRLYREGYGVEATGNLEEQLREAVSRLPERRPIAAPAASVPVKRPAPVTLPALKPHVTEGSFFIGEDQAICQIVCGRPEPVVYGGTKLKAGGTMTAKRIASLIRIRDSARLVLQSQNEGWAEELREEARRELNRHYDVFVQQYGLINKTTYSESSTGAVIERMVNLVKFREDPDANLVMALEECDPTSGTAVKAAIMLRDVVGKAPEITSVTTAEEGLLVSLDRKGFIDLGYIAALYHAPETKVVEELSDLVYQDPLTGSWQVADDYLSGDVRHKLKVAEAAGPEFARNAEALRAVQPEDVLPGDIDANLGAPWIPEGDVREFAASLFGVEPTSISIGHLARDAVWSVDADFRATGGVQATADYGTPRANGVWLLELALNMKTPVIYDTIQGPNGEERVVNADETLAAREKQKRLKERFKSWVFDDAERCERLVRTYNDTYNSIRLRVFDGSHLDFPGMNRTVELRQHQKDAIWRGMTGGNCLLAHVVGAGKTYSMAAIGMKRRQAGLTQKPLYVVPNHMLEQFAREFIQLYPDARLLVATKDDLARERRKILTAKIAGSVWDGIVITHSSFERIGMSKGYQEKFLRGQIAQYDALLVDTARTSSKAQRNLIKTIEKQKARREERLKELLAEDKKDDGLVFDELGVDYLFVDEAHYFKNLETPTKMERVAGIQTGGSERAFDLFMKCRYLSEKHEGHGVCFATGTPISNTMVEMYTLSRYLDPKALEERGIDHFDAWAATFGEVVESMEISPDGASLRPRSRFARFLNLPELQQLFRSFADVQTAEMLDLPRPGLSGGKPAVIPSPMSDEQHAIQQRLVERYDRIRSSKVDPREDNALAITTDGRKLALDLRLISAGGVEPPGSKVNALVERVAEIHRQSEASKGSQLVFCDMGVNPTPWGFSVYDELIGKLTAAGIPRHQIAAVGDAESDAKKQSLFEKVRQGVVRVLIGSTAKLGSGVNVQRRLVALHHLDAPWKPAEVEQREGRILRQGNENEEVSIFRYVTESSFDAYMWQALETKARFISQVMTGQSAARRAEDGGGEALSYAEVKAIASGNPAVLVLAEADAELQRLSVLKKNSADEQFLARRGVRELPEIISRSKTRLSEVTADFATAREHESDPVTFDGVSCPREKLMAVLGGCLDALPEEVKETRRFPIGRVRGLGFGLIRHRFFPPEVFLEGATTRVAQVARDAGPRAVWNAVERLFSGFEPTIQKRTGEIAQAETKLRDFTARLGNTFPYERYMGELATLRDELKVALSATTPQEGAGRSAAEVAELITALKGRNSVEAVVVSRPRVAARAERPVTARVRGRAEAGRPEEIPAVSEEAEPRGEEREEEEVEMPSPFPVEVVSPPTPTLPRVPRIPPEGRRRRYQKFLF